VQSGLLSVAIAMPAKDGRVFIVKIPEKAMQRAAGRSIACIHGNSLPNRAAARHGANA
jgi:hypothetical protein